MSNPYNKIDPMSFLIRSFGKLGDFQVFIVDMGSDAFAGCVFRDHLSCFLLDELEGEFHLGNDDRFISRLGNNLALGIKNPFDIQRLRDNFSVA